MKRFILTILCLLAIAHQAQAAIMIESPNGSLVPLGTQNMTAACAQTLPVHITSALTAAMSNYSSATVHTCAAPIIFEEDGMLGNTTTFRFSSMPTIKDTAQHFNGTGAVGGMPYFVPQWIGADPTGVADSTTAFTSAAIISPNLYLKGGTFKVAGLTVNSQNWYGDNAIIRGSGDLIVNEAYSHFEKITFRNVGSPGKLITIATGGVRPGDFIDCQFGYANYHIYQPAGGGNAVVAARFVRCYFGVTNLADSAQIYSRWYNGIINYSEDNCYTHYNLAGLYFTGGSDTVRITGVYEYNGTGAIYVNVATGTSAKSINLTGVHFEVNGNTTPSPDITLTAATGSGIEIALNDVTQNGSTVNPNIVIAATGSGTVYVRLNNSYDATITAPVTNNVRIYRNDNDAITGTFGMTMTGLTVVGGTGPTYGPTFTQIGNLVTFNLVINPQGGTTASTNGSTYVTITSPYWFPSVVWGTCSATLLATNTATGNGSVNGTKIYLPTWAANNGLIHVYGSWLIQ